MEDETAAASGTACPAPDLVMDFDPEGNVQACCVGALHPLGNVGQLSIREIWEGERAQTLRDALARHDYDFGCGSCRHRLAEQSGPPDAEYYRTMPPSPDPAWPQVMAFALNNTCNLQCVMCGGNFSSKIRSQREHRPKLVPPYGDAFYEQLREFVPHLRRIELRGGEPFLIKENHRIWDLVLELGLEERLEMQLTTNGTVWNDDVERVLDAIPMQITMSMDGITAETNEAIRIGTDHATVLENFDRFAAYATRRGTRLDLSFCVLRHNWRELGDIVEHADRRGVDAHAQQVLEREHALHRLPTEQLQQVLDALHERGESLDLQLESNRWTWNRILGWLQYELDHRDGSEPLLVWEQPAPGNAPHAERTRARVLDQPDPGRRRGLRERLAGARVPTEVADRWQARLARWSSDGAVGELVTGPDGTITSADLGLLTPPDGEPPADVVGLTFAQALERLTEQYGPHLALAYEFVEDDGVDQVVFLAQTPFRQKTGLVVRFVSLAEQRGGRPTGTIRTLVGTDTYFWPEAGHEQPVQLTPPRRRTPTPA
jgi:MoaA/NifB/PqqE/SkfB family radical SAM enzyme